MEYNFCNYIYIPLQDYEYMYRDLRVMCNNLQRWQIVIPPPGGSPYNAQVREWAVTVLRVRAVS